MKSSGLVRGSSMTSRSSRIWSFRPPMSAYRTTPGSYHKPPARTRADASLATGVARGSTVTRATEAGGGRRGGGGADLVEHVKDHGVDLAGQVSHHSQRRHVERHAHRWRQL